MHFHGLGVDKDWDKAVEFFEQAAHERSVDAIYNMGVVHLTPPQGRELAALQVHEKPGKKKRKKRKKRSTSKEAPDANSETNAESPRNASEVSISRKALHISGLLPDQATCWP